MPSLTIVKRNPIIIRGNPATRELMDKANKLPGSKEKITLNEALMSLKLGRMGVKRWLERIEKESAINSGLEHGTPKFNLAVRAGTKSRLKAYFEWKKRNK